jgi:hypothetical protein
VGLATCHCTAPNCRAGSNSSQSLWSIEVAEVGSFALS